MWATCRRIAVGCVAVVVASATPAAADANTAAAEAAFQRGVQLRDEGNWDAACTAFGQSQQLDPQHGTAFNLAGCYVKIGKVVLAWALYSELGQRDTNAGRKARAAKLAAELKPKLSWLRIDVAEKPAELAVTVDGEPVTRLLGIDAPFDVGTHEIVATARGRQPWSKTVTIRAQGDRKTVAIPALAAADATGKDATGKDATTKDATTKDATTKDATGKDATGRDATAKDRAAKQTVAAVPAGEPDVTERADVDTAAAPSPLLVTLTASLGMYSAPPGTSVAPALALGAGAAIGYAFTPSVGAAVIANGDVVVDHVTFERLFAGAGISLGGPRWRVHAAPGLSILTGAGDTVLGFGGDAAATLALTRALGISLHLNVSSVAQPPGLMGNLTVLRTGVGISYLR
jgi:hypothetical protein